MKSKKKAKKTALTIVTLSVVTAILFTAAAAEEINFSRPLPADMPAAVTVMPAPVMVTAGQPQSQAPAPDASRSESSTETNDTAPETNQAPDSDPVTAAPDSETGVYAAATSTHTAAYSPADLMLAAGQTIASFTKQFDGYRYVYGAESPAYGFDCSGLVYYVYTQFGYTLPRTASAQYKNGISVEPQDLTPGDLVFFATAGGRSVSHVGIYVGDGQFIHAATSQHGVMISALDNSYWAKAYIGAKRLVTPESSFQLLCLPAFEHLL